VITVGTKEQLKLFSFKKHLKMGVVNILSLVVGACFTSAVALAVL
jgi:hypothetical protein